MENVANSADPLKWVLFLAGDGKNPILQCNGRYLQLPNRMARIILLLQRARVADEHHPEGFQGFRKAREIALVYDENPRVDPPLHTTITAYFYQFCRRLKQPPFDQPAFPDLIVRVRNSGARLLYPVEIKELGGPPVLVLHPQPPGQSPQQIRVPRAKARKPAASRRRRAGTDSA